MDSNKNRVSIKRSLYVALTLAFSLLLAGTLFVYSIPDQIKIFADETKILNLPLKHVTIEVLPETKVIPGGQSVGVKMDVKGVLVVGLEEIDSITGEAVNPGIKAGLEIGDSILTINNVSVYTAADVEKIVNELKGKVRIKINRRGEIMQLELTPVQSADDNLYKIGVWVRDKTAGLGTLTFYNPESHTFGALGHAITDPDTGSILGVKEGELLNARVESVKQGTAGNPGEIRGIFYEADEPLGNLQKNTAFGIFGATYDEIENPYYKEPLSIGYQSEVKIGPAYILTTVAESRIERYQIVIEEMNHQTKPSTKSMVIRVTDERLIKKTGGIVQGMSGSPIIQNNKIVGAVTHVFVNDPKRGYGIYIEWMLQEAN